MLFHCSPAVISIKLAMSIYAKRVQTVVKT